MIVSSGDARKRRCSPAPSAARSGPFAQPAGRGFLPTSPSEWREDAPPIERVELDQAEGIVCCGLFDDQNEVPEDYRARLMLAREAGLPLLCANPDVVVDLGASGFTAPARWPSFTRISAALVLLRQAASAGYDLARRRLVCPTTPLSCRGRRHCHRRARRRGRGIDVLFVSGGLAYATSSALMSKTPPGHAERMAGAAFGKSALQHRPAALRQAGGRFFDAPPRKRPLETHGRLRDTGLDLGRAAHPRPAGGI